MNSSSSPPHHLQPLLPLLPDEIAVACIALVPRSSHPNLSLVSRSWRALLKSDLLFAVRSDLAGAEHFLCLNIRTAASRSIWYLLHRPPGRNPRPLLPLPQPPIPTNGSSCASLGPKIFVLGGTVNGIPTSNVQIFDARFNKWDVGPPMRVSREFAAAGVVDGRVYVLGGCLPLAVGWAEVFDPVLGSWSPVPSPDWVREKWMHGSAVLDGKILAVADRGGLVFEPRSLSWDSASTVLDMGWKGRATVVDGLLYSYDYLGKIKGYDWTEDRWREVEDVDKELPRFLHGASLANVGDRLCVVWEGKRKKNRKEMEILCADIAVSKESGGRLRGSIVWSEAIMLSVPKGSLIAHCLAVKF